MKIGIMGGVFDPPHNGHIESIKHILGEQIVDRIIIIPCLQQPLKDTVRTPYNIRMEMAEAAFNNIDNISISDIENHLPMPSYTVNTLRYLSEKFPNDELFLIIGYDEAEMIHKWHDYKILKEYANFIIIRRDENVHNIDREYFNDAVFANNSVIPISSSQIRKSVKEDDIGKYTVENVIEIIKRENLYK